MATYKIQITAKSDANDHVRPGETLHLPLDSDTYRLTEISAGGVPRWLADVAGKINAEVTAAALAGCYVDQVEIVGLEVDPMEPFDQEMVTVRIHDDDVTLPVFDTVAAMRAAHPEVDPRGEIEEPREDSGQIHTSGRGVSKFETWTDENEFEITERVSGFLAMKTFEGGGPYVAVLRLDRGSNRVYESWTAQTDGAAASSRTSAEAAVRNLKRKIKQQSAFVTRAGGAVVAGDRYYLGRKQDVRGFNGALVQGEPVEKGAEVEVLETSFEMVVLGRSGRRQREYTIVMTDGRVLKTNPVTRYAMVPS